MLQQMRMIDLRQLLKSLCNDSHWKYAVFWELKSRSPMILTWGDGHLEHRITRLPQDFMSSVINPCETHTNYFSFCDSRIQNSGFEDYSLGQAVAYMSHLQYALDEGFVGRVASSGIYSWILLDNIFTQMNSTCNIEIPNEWLLQLASGIKTILLVPVLPHGVLQLGSLEVVTEDLAEVACIKDSFTYLFAKSASFHVANIFNNFNNLEEEPIDDMNPMLSNSNCIAPVSRAQEENEVYVQPVILRESSAQTCQVTAGLTEVGEKNLFGGSNVDEELINNVRGENLNIGVLQGSFCGFYSAEFMEEETGDYNTTDKNLTSMECIFSFPADCELHKALGPSFRGSTCEMLSQSTYIGNDTISKLKFNKDPIDGSEATWPSRERGSEHLQEDVVIKRYSNSDDTSSSKLIDARSITTTGQFSASALLLDQSELNAFMRDDDSSQGSHLNSIVFTNGRDALTDSSMSTSLMSLRTLNVNELGKNGGRKTQSKKGLKFSTASRRRDMVGDNQRQRPRDRQLIQDRVKELRELVPNGAKCSIDGLLDRTIKHMLYLRGLSEQAKKLKQLVHKEASRRKKWTSPEIKNGWKNGASWAFELLSEPQACPIVVEDLDFPGHMLIEMICNEDGLFLEIAQVIRRLDMTILKGVVECDRDNAWAHFIVEGSRGFSRMDLFWPLMHLLQRRTNHISSKI